MVEVQITYRETVMHEHIYKMATKWL